MTRKQFWRGMSRAAFDSDFIATRITLALAELAWAIMLFWPGDTFERPTYQFMSELAPELAWALVFLLSSAAQISIALSGSCNTVFARAFGVWNAALWIITVGTMLWAVYPPPAAIGGEFALMLAAIWIGIRPAILAHLHKKCYGSGCRV